MCTRFSLVATEGEIINTFPGKTFHPLYSTYKQHLHIPKYNIPHEAFAHVITNSEPEVIQLFRWGYIPNESPFPSVDFYNYLTQSETMLEKKTYKKAALSRRCLILADGIVDWDTKEKPPKPYRFLIKDQPIFALAGIWDSWVSKESNVTLNTFSILTTRPNSLYVHKRMPVILNREDQENYLFTNDENKLLDFCISYPSYKMDLYLLTSKINNPDNDTKAAIAEKISKKGQQDLF